MQQTMTQTKGGSCLFWFLLVGLIAGAGFYLMASSLTPTDQADLGAEIGDALAQVKTARQPMVNGVPQPQVQAQPHADQVHKDYAPQLRKCNIIEIWIDPTGETFHCIRQLPDGRAGDQIVQGDPQPSGNCLWWEITCFLKNGGDLEKINKNLKNKGLEQVAP